jgi:hypothetical protein
MKKPTTLVLRTCSADMASHGGFLWPQAGPVECSDWDPKPQCGGGLHGLPWGVGDAGLLSAAPAARWLVVEVPTDELVELGDKCKFPRGTVIFCGEREGALRALDADGRALAHPTVFAVRTSGYGGTSISGDEGTSISGDGGTSTSGDRGTSTSDNYGTSVSGARGTSTSGYLGTSISGYLGTSISGYLGTSISGHAGTVRSGRQGTLQLRWWDAASSRSRLVVAYVGEDGIEPDVPYRLDDADHRFVRAS